MRAIDLFERDITNLGVLAFRNERALLAIRDQSWSQLHTGIGWWWWFERDWFAWQLAQSYIQQDYSI